MAEAFELQGRGSGGSGSTAVAPLVLKKPCGGRLILFELPMFIQDVLAEAFLRQSQKIVLVVQQGASEAPNGAVLRDLFGLTSAEARLAGFISNGSSPREAAGTLGITEETARSVLKRIFHKTGTNRQSQLAALLSGIGLKTLITGHASAARKMSRTEVLSETVKVWATSSEVAFGRWRRPVLRDLTGPGDDRWPDPS